MQIATTRVVRVIVNVDDPHKLNVQMEWRISLGELVSSKQNRAQAKTQGLGNEPSVRPDVGTRCARH